MQQDHNCYSFALTDHVKQDRPGNVFGTLRLFKCLVPGLCVYVTLQYYLVVTSKLRTSSKLLVSYNKPYNAVTSSTIGRWISCYYSKRVLILKRFRLIARAVLRLARLLFLLLQTLFLRLLVGLVNQPFVSILKSL